jgi:hypothetical protein
MQYPAQFSVRPWKFLPALASLSLFRMTFGLHTFLDLSNGADFYFQEAVPK